MDKKTVIPEPDDRYNSVKEYYGQVLQKTSDLKTDACCCCEQVGTHIREALDLIDCEIKEKYYGCGSPIPLCMENLRVLDLGCGTGRDCYVMSKLVGTDGFVSGIDMTENQIKVAEKYVDKQTKAFGYEKPNVKFIFDYIENMGKYFAKESLDLVTSNCVINLTEDKGTVLREVYSMLKFGGEMYFSDVYVDKPLSKELSSDPVLRGECLGGALYYEDFVRITKEAGFSDPRVVSCRGFEVNNEQIHALVGDTKFYSITYRLWKLNAMEESCEDDGHIALYNGRIPESPDKFVLDDKNTFYSNKNERVSGNTALILSQTRFKKYFEIRGD